MKYTKFVLTFALLLLVMAQSDGQFKKSNKRSEIDFSGYLNRTTISHRGGTAYLHIDINTPKTETRYRKPMNIAVVLDRSGSMKAEGKMDYAKSAVTYLIDRLSENDYFSLVIYDDEVEVLTTPQRVKNKTQLKSLVSEIYARGSTNLGGGMIEGFKQAERYAGNEFVSRVILLSDGLANQGITDPHELSSFASRYRNKSISLSTMGVGLDYNENMMLSLAESGGGSYYFIESSRQIASIFEKEFNGISEVYAQNGSIELDLGRDVTLDDVIGCEWNRENTKVISIGDLYSNDHRELTIALRIPEGTGVKRVATASLKFDSRRRDIGRLPRFSVDIRYTDNVVELDKGVNLDVQGKVDVALSTRTVEKAIEQLDAGDIESAQQTIRGGRAMIQNSPAMSNSAAAPMMQEQMNTLDAYSKEMRDSSKDKREVKKSIQYRNYKVQKKK